MNLKSPRWIFLAVLLAVSLLSLAGCKHDSSRCTNDEDCAATGNLPSDKRYCANGMCVECRKDAHCDDDTTCERGVCKSNASEDAGQKDTGQKNADDQKRADRQTDEREAPNEQQDESDDRPTETFTVDTAQKLVETIGPDRVIELEPGDYELAEATEIDHDYVNWKEVGGGHDFVVRDGRELVVRDVENLTIRAAEDSRPNILTRPQSGFVMRFVEVEDISLRGLVLGHGPGGSCTAGVLRFEGARDITVSDADLYGSGTVGVSLEDVKQFRLEDSTVRECTDRIARIDGTDDAVFENVQFTHNAEYDLVDVTDSPSVQFDSCTFADNRIMPDFGRVFFKTDENSSIVLNEPVFEDNTYEQLTNARDRLTIDGKSAQKQVRELETEPDPQFNHVYDLVRYRDWVVAATGAGLVFWNPSAERVEKLVKTGLGSGLTIYKDALWTYSENGVLRFDGLDSESFLTHVDARDGKPVVARNDSLVVKLDRPPDKPTHWWRWNPSDQAFDPIDSADRDRAPAALGGGRYDIFRDALVRENGDVWGVDFLNGIVWAHADETTRLALESERYPGSDPRSFYEDPNGVLWVADFDSGFLRYDETEDAFVEEPTLTEKASDIAVDLVHDRTWLLHYTDGVYLKRPGQETKFFEFENQKYLHALLLDGDGIWVSGWKGLIHLERTGGDDWKRETFEIDSSTVPPSALP